MPDEPEWLTAFALTDTVEDLRSKLSRCQDELKARSREIQDLNEEIEARKTMRHPEGEKTGGMEGVGGRELIGYYLFPIILSGFTIAFVLWGPGGVAPRILAGVAFVVSPLAFWRLGWETRFRGIEVGPYDWIGLGLVFFVFALLAGMGLGVGVS
jgi:hypothetical protein